MVLHCYGRTEDQYTVAAATKPDKNDKNVSPQEMVVYAYSLGDMFAVMGYATDVRVLKLLLSNDYPVIVETWFIPEPEDEMGHYRLLTGYDDAAQQFTTQDSYNGPNQLVSYDELDALWKVFNRVYVVVSEAGRAQELTLLLDNVTDAEAMYRNALSIALGEVAEDAKDRYAWVNIGSNYVALGRHAEAANAYDRARTLNLPWRMLWYQFGPFEAYLRVGRYQDVIDLANANLRAAGNLEESYYYRALARRALGDEDGAREDLYKALKYHPHYAQAVEALTE
jgi:tetratricopeptide (TPR) repeat protein